MKQFSVQSCCLYSLWPHQLSIRQYSWRFHRIIVKFFQSCDFGMCIWPSVGLRPYFLCEYCQSINNDLPPGSHVDISVNHLCMNANHTFVFGLRKLSFTESFFLAFCLARVFQQDPWRGSYCSFCNKGN